MDKQSQLTDEPRLDSESMRDALEVFRTDLKAWLRSKSGVLTEFRVEQPTAELTQAVDGRLMKLLCDDGWGLRGWPQKVGGLGGPPLLRAVLYDELERSGYVVPMQYEMIETLAPAVIKYAPAVAAELLPPALRGDRKWAQGFSEPEAGSDLASLTCRASRDGDHYVVSGQKVWQSQAIAATVIGNLVRTGTPDSRHKGLSMLMIDLDSPGIEVRPIRYSSGRNELTEVFFSDVIVPAERLVGEEGQGWSIAMYLLQYERANYAWLRQARMARLLGELVERTTRTDDSAAQELGRAWLAQQAVRIRCGRTIQRLAAGETLGPEASIDKVLLGTAEQRVADAGLELCRSEFLFDDDLGARDLRSNWFYSRAATIYGGAAEVQRTIIATRVLDLPAEAR